MEKLSSVLLVDDDSTNNFLNEWLLNKLQVAERILVAENGTQALALLEQLARTNEPGLILLDANMPGLNGIGFLEAYRQLPQAGNSVVVMLTATLDSRQLGHLGQLDIAALVSKPLTEGKVNQILQQHFQRSLPVTTPR